MTSPLYLIASGAYGTSVADFDLSDVNPPQYGVLDEMLRSLEAKAARLVDDETAPLDLITGLVDPDDYVEMDEDEIAALEAWAFDPERDLQHDDERGGR